MFFVNNDRVAEYVDNSGDLRNCGVWQKKSDEKRKNLHQHAAPQLNIINSIRVFIEAINAIRKLILN
jgi:hypothetical protein